MRQAACPRCAALKRDLQEAREQLAVLRSDLEVAERVAAEARRNLELCLEQCEGLYDFAPNAYVTLDRSGIIQDANVAAADLLGEPRLELRGTPFIRFVAKKDRPACFRHLGRCRKSRYPARIATDLNLCLGDRPCEVHMLSVPDPSPHQSLYRTALVDISERRRAERALQDSESRYRLLFEANPCPMYIFDESTLNVLDVNAAAQHLYGYSREAFLEMTVRDIRQPEEIPPVLAAIRAQHRLLRRGMAKVRRAHGQESGAGIALAAGEWRHVKRDGTGFDASITISSIQYEGREARLVMVTDVTARKQADESLRNLTAELERRVGERTAAARETMERLQATLVAANVVAWDLDLASGRLLETGPVATFFGMPEGFLHGDDASFLMSIHPGDRAGVRTHVERAIQRGSASYAVEFRIIHPDGGIRWAATTGQVERDAAGRPVRLRGITSDITARKEAESVQARTHRALSVLTECGHELLRSSSEQDLLDMACRIAVEVGGYQMAWVGYAENDARKSIRPMALVGSAKDDLSRMHLTWADTKFGCGPTGEAIRTGQPCRCQDIAKDLMHAPWRADALKHGYASALALPLMSEQECLGALTIYAAHREAFDEVEVSLLQQLANDLTVGIMSIRARAQRAVLERQVLDISESVQRRIGQDLHDGVGQSIIGIGYLVSAVQQALAGKSAPEAADLEGITRLIWKAVQEMRDMARGLFPGDLINGQLTDALQELARHTEDVFGTACHFSGPSSVRLADANLASQVYRIAQEAVNNAAKHSKTKEIRIGLLKNRDGMVLTVRDTGVGLPRTSGKSAGMGHRIMKYRADLIGAGLKIESRRGQGTTVTCTLPRARIAGTGRRPHKG